MADPGTLSEDPIAPAIDFMPVATMVADRSGAALAVNPAWLQLSGGTEPSSLGQGWQRLIPARDRPRLLLALRRMSERGGTETVDQELDLERGSRWTRWTLRGHPGRGRPVVVAVVVDLDAEHSLQMDLHHRATHDALTGLVNRAEFLDVVSRAMGRRAGPVGIVYVDLDRFKEVNDEGGHRLGDRVLAAVARRLRAGVRPPDVVARVGGDEFAVLCHDLRRVDALEAVARRLRAALRAPLEIDGELRVIGASTGVAVVRPGSTPEQALDAADRAMYAAKCRRRAKPPQTTPRAGAGVVPEAQADPGGAGPCGEELMQHLVTARISLESCALSAPEGAADDLWAAIDEVDTVLSHLRPDPPPRAAGSGPRAYRPPGYDAPGDRPR
ncbi:MAG TPA: GGDEF domain-containing protein [Acidimicrobiales bacterium]|nr:GGDEF domain-containing protein [Acidimicrobiales bacterium]